MGNDFLIAIVFVVTALIQVSLIHTLPDPYLTIPLHFIIGVIVLHRNDPVLGAIWFMAAGFFLSWVGFDHAVWWSYFLIAAVGYFLTHKVFASRSVYALIGLGTSMYFIFSILNFIPVLLGVSSDQSQFISRSFIGLLFLIFGLYFGFLITRYLEHLATNVFLIKSRR